MRIVIAGKATALVDTLRALHMTDTNVSVVGEAHTEGELFQMARTEQPEMILLDWAFRPRFTAEWVTYLSSIAGGARVVAVYAPGA